MSAFRRTAMFIHSPTVTSNLAVKIPISDDHRGRDGATRSQFHPVLGIRAP
jgi:hypothetical protein